MCVARVDPGQLHDGKIRLDLIHDVFAGTLSGEPLRALAFEHAGFGLGLDQGRKESDHRREISLRVEVFLVEEPVAKCPVDFSQGLDVLVTPVCNQFRE